MRAATLVRICMVLMFVASIGVAGTTVVMKTAETFLAEVDRRNADDLLQQVQADQIERQLRSYQVRLNADGLLEGRINVINPTTGEVGTAEDMAISFLQNGAVVRQVFPGIEGTFSAAVAPGVYSIVGSGPDGYIAYSVNVLPAELTVQSGESDELQPVAYQEVEEQLAIDSVAVPASDLPTIARLAINNIPPELLQPQASGEGAVPADSIEDAYDAAADKQKNVALSGHRVRVQEDGTVRGRVARVNPQGQPTRIRRLNVFLVQNNEVVSQSSVDELGTFTFFDVPDGIYSFAAAGMEGMAAFTIQAVSSAQLAGLGLADEIVLPVGKTHPVSMVQQVLDFPGFGSLVVPDDVFAALDTLINNVTGGQYGLTDVLNDPSLLSDQQLQQLQDELPPEGGGGAGTGGSTGTGGGGGGGGGGLGLGEILAAAALGLGAYALSEANESNNQVISPFFPQN